MKMINGFIKMFAFTCFVLLVMQVQAATINPRLTLFDGNQFNYVYKWEGNENITPTDYQELVTVKLPAPIEGAGHASVRVVMALTLAIPAFPSTEVLQFELSYKNATGTENVKINYVSSDSFTNTQTAEFSTLTMYFPAGSKDFTFKMYGWPFIGAPFLQSIILKDINFEVHYD
ncbi:MAG: hypothetical protein HQK51_10190 [Oligoflexia bacterium]|nr:hypothetical protein [Oligoflexia bacterium]